MNTSSRVEVVAGRFLVVVCVAVVLSCDDAVETDAAADAPTDADAGADADDALDVSCTRPCGAICCADGEVCTRGACIDEVSCAGGEPCQGDSYCADGLCVPFGPPFSDYDEACIREVEPLETFEPEIQCEWPLAEERDALVAMGLNVETPPLVGDLDGDGRPEIVFASGPSCGGATPSVVRAIGGDDCRTVWTAEPIVSFATPLALVDFSGDGTIEVCGQRMDGVPFCLSHEGEVLWTGHDDSGEEVAAGAFLAGVAIADVDGEGAPEVVVGLSVFDGETGHRELDGPIVAAEPHDVDVIPSVVDRGGDGYLEGLTGRYVVDLADPTAAITDWGGGLTHGFTAVADLDFATTGPELVVVSPETAEVRVHSIDGEILFRHGLPGGYGGPPSVADLDGDGHAEFAVASRDHLTAFDLDCDDTVVDPELCFEQGEGGGVLWSIGTHDYSSGVTGSSVFDFEGDGAVEVVYADECYIRVFDGLDGSVKFSAFHESDTSLEYPTVADVDGDFFSEIVVPHACCGVSCPPNDPFVPGATREAGCRYAGITVYRDRQDRWAPSRPLWSQHTEHFYQRNDDGTVPPVEQPSWGPLQFNSYRQAHPPQDIEAYFIPDLTVGGLDATEGCVVAEGEEVGVQQLTARVCNRGTLPVSAGVEVSFHLGATDGEVLCTAVTTGTLERGACEEVGCPWDAVPVDREYEVVAVVDPDGARVECHEDNNQASRRDRCPRPPDWPY